MAKAKTAKLPKRVLGVKIPKKMRKGPLAEMLLSPVGQVLIAEMIYHVGVSLTQRAGDSATGRRMRNRVGLARADVSGTLGRQASLLQHAFGGALEHFMATMKNGGAADGDFAARPSASGNSTDTLSGDEPGRLPH